MTIKKVVFIAVLCVVMFAMASTSKADLTPISSGGGSGEPDLYGPGGVLDDLYGWANVTRIDDGPLPGDQIWIDVDGGVTAVAKWAAYSHQLGYSVDEVGGRNQHPVA